MRLRVLAGLLLFGIGVGALLGLTFPQRLATPANDPLIDEYVRVVSALHARGESLAAVEARLARLGYGTPAEVVQAVAARSNASVAESGTDLSSMLAALSPDAQVSPQGTPRMLASGRGAGPTPTSRADAAASAAATPTAPVEYPRPGRLATGKTEASLRTKPSLSAPVIRILRRDSDFAVLGIERGQAVEGAEERWYKVKAGDSTGYVYFTLIEQSP